MKKLVLVIVMIACLVGITGQASAATFGNIAVTVSLVSVTSVSVTPDTWNIGTIGFGGTNVLAVSATNNGTESIDLTITGADSAAGAWLIGSTVPPGADEFSVEAKTGTPALNNSDSIFLTSAASAPINAAAITAGNSQDFSLEYTAPSSNTDTVGDPQGFTIVITASAV